MALQRPLTCGAGSGASSLSYVNELGLTLGPATLFACPLVSPPIDWMRTELDCTGSRRDVPLGAQR